MEFLQQNYITIFILTAFALSFLIGPFVVEFCKEKIKNDATERRYHSIPTPSSGGIGFVSILIPLLLALVFLEYAPLNISLFLLVMLLSSIIIAILGFYDDKHDLAAKKRLFWQSVAVILPLCFLPSVFENIPEYIEKPIVFIAWMWFLNLYNFIDGIDGYSSSQAIFICIMSAFVFPLFAPLFLVIAAGVAGFLRVNFPMPNAKIFMGDGASTFIGFTLGGLMFAASTFDGSLPFIFITITAVVSCDTSQTILKRIIRGQTPLMFGHKEQWIARMHALGFSHKRITLTGIVTSLFVGVAVYFTYDNELKYISPLLGMLIFTILAFYIKYKEKKAGIKMPGFHKRDRY